LVFTPYKKWKEEHRQHHRTVGNIDKRGVGDVWTMTVDEYESTTKLKRFGYKLYRNPLVLFVIGPVYIFLVSQRFPSKPMTKEFWIDLIINNLGVLVIIITVTFTVGIKYYLLIQLPVISIAASLGVWLFYIQHQYDEVYWEDSEHWSILDAAFKGSSVYKLPAVLNWFTGSIGYHNIHHLNAKIPNYRLKKLYNTYNEMRQSKKIKIFQSIRLAGLFLYDEKAKRLISYRKYRKSLS
jgi:omega-6 fatty acid desaturase (delta-12 desaturase)